MNVSIEFLACVCDGPGEDVSTTSLERSGKVHYQLLYLILTNQWFIVIRVKEHLYEDSPQHAPSTLFSQPYGFMSVGSGFSHLLNYSGAGIRKNSTLQF
jgi:hypothetical protein